MLARTRETLWVPRDELSSLRRLRRLSDRRGDGDVRVRTSLLAVPPKLNSPLSPPNFGHENQTQPTLPFSYQPHGLTVKLKANNR